MKNAQILDCTLRDGAYLVDKTFGAETIEGIICGLIEAKIDWIEIGFLQDDGFGEGKTVYENGADAKKVIPTKKGDSKFTVLADYSRYTIDHLEENRHDSIDGVRECFFKEERYQAVQVCQAIKEKGYQLFVQPVDILGYQDQELIELIQMVNALEPYCFSIVDTFGSMYAEDLQRVFYLIHHNLYPKCKIGFHSHNNMQMSNALSQEFLKISSGKREVVIDATISGMGRGAGNTPTELIANYMVQHLGYTYDMNALLDIIDSYMDNIRSRCEWGYNTPYFLAGCYSAHVNNIAYLLKKNTLRSRDLSYLLNSLGEEQRKKYDYEQLENYYMQYMKSDIEDEGTMEELREKMRGKNILVLVPGASVMEELEVIQKAIQEQNPLILSVNFLHENFTSDYIYMSNVRRYQYWLNNERFKRAEKIITSNVMEVSPDKTMHIISFIRLAKRGWENIDNSTIMLLRLLDQLAVGSIAIAGFDGYGQMPGKNYASPNLELSNVRKNAKALNEEIGNMLTDYMHTRKNQIPIHFITKSLFEAQVNGEQNHE
jgi:4-hydroxy 2-oxovalerate aldolase